MDKHHEAQEVLSQVFGHSQFWPLQKKIIDHVLDKKSALTLMPTGGGKSLCYQIPGLIFEGTTIVISPLIALMKDQVDQLRAKGVSAAFINSSLKKEERQKWQKKLAEGKLKLLYVTPERFRKPEFIEAITKTQVSLLAVDEAHCISQWGQDFRPEYAKVGEIRRRIGSPPVLALTATATKEVADDILNQLGIEKECLFSSGVLRPNLSLNVIPVYGIEEKVLRLVSLLHEHKTPCIVYVSLISTLYKVQEALRKVSLNPVVYHGDLPDKQRRLFQEQFIKGENSFILATPAFGLGIDKPDIRQVVHFELPNSLEAYFQEVGRAGRDGKPSVCTLLYDSDDIATQMEFLKWSSPDGHFIRRVYELLETHKDQVKAEGVDYLRGQMNFYNSRDFRVETALNLLRAFEVVEGFNVVGELPSEIVNQEQRELRLKRQQEKLLKIVQWTSEKSCRMKQVQDYFGDKGTQDCGICDNCRGEVS